MSEDDDMEQLREERMEELRDQVEERDADDTQEQAQAQAEAQKQAILRQYLTDGARQRLNSVRMSKPEFADQVEQQLIAIARSGRINGKIDEDQMRELLSEMTPDSKSFDIKRR